MPKKNMTRPDASRIQSAEYKKYGGSVTSKHFTARAMSAADRNYPDYYSDYHYYHSSEKKQTTQGSLIKKILFGLTIAIAIDGYFYKFGNTIYLFSMLPIPEKTRDDITQVGSHLLEEAPWKARDIYYDCQRNWPTFFSTIGSTAQLLANKTAEYCSNLRQYMSLK